MKKILSTISILICLTMVLQSCSKQRGCNDENACNFDDSAEKYDGTCIYAEPWYYDGDNDGFGDPNISITQCDQPENYVDNANGSTGFPATDFTAIDCDGISHNLFTELDNNTIVIISWVMPCSSCIADPLEVTNAVQAYATTHPGRVKFYLVDDYANTPCNGFTVWASVYGITDCTIFSDPSIDMNDYGVPGMPKTVVIAGSNHQVYFNKSESTAGLTDAIDQALIDNP
ncbi:MAG: hypothetical protein JKX68_11560 [Flavobacteriales bacterium]|nr:hypothetical protein [Flavobacteriales bacterium]